LVKKYINGEIEFIGRLDRQIKLNGFLICPEEIELVIKSFDSIKNSIVVKENNYLVAYIETTETIDISELKSFLNKFLNSYMIPSDFIFVKKIPLLSTGKIDIGALKKLPLKISTKITTDSLNVNLISIIDSYKSVLNTDSITYCNFFFRWRWKLYKSNEFDYRFRKKRN
jgi:acyl-coenzyme A synthetase/AMP-(fatty) acid ligase